MVYDSKQQQQTGGAGRGLGGPRGFRPQDAPRPESVEKFKKALAASGTFSDDRVMSLASDLAGDFARGFRREKKESGKTQIRKVYGEIRALKEKAKAGFQTVRPEIRLIQAHVAYAVGRDTLTPPFKEFADQAVSHLLDKGSADELDRFVRFFEAMYAHFYFATSKHGQREG